MNMSKHIERLKPDLVLLTTPHGLNIQNAVGIYQTGINCKASGTAEWNNEWKNYTADINLSGNDSQSLYDELNNKDDIPLVMGLRTFGGLSTPMRWGEVVPLWFTLASLDEASKSKTKFVILSLPRVSSQTHPGRLIALGRSIRGWCKQQQQRILVVISGDQAHTHPWSMDPSVLPVIYAPDQSCWKIFPPSGTKQAKVFDDAIQQWARGKGDQHLLVVVAGEVEKEAMSCGYSGSLLMEGLMNGDKIIDCTDIPLSSTSLFDKGDGDGWNLVEFAFECPTYYSMMAALYLPKLIKELS